MIKRLIFIVTVCLLSMSLQAIELSSLKQQTDGQHLIITPKFQVDLTQKVIDAIDNGIVITFVYQAQLYQTKDWWFDTKIDSKSQAFEVRYISLLRQYQLLQTHSKTELKFITLNELLTHLGQQTTFEFKANSSIDYIETRIFLDKQALPSIMQLPNVFDADWNLNSDWQQTKVSATESSTQKP